jgi:dTDP-4-amino-4,6-dideoxygalactose transaminase
MQAAMLRVKLRSLDKWNNRRRQIAQIYSQGLKDSSVIIPVEQKDITNNYYLYVVRAKNRDDFQKYLDNQNIQTLIHYPIPIHQQDAFFEYSDVSLPITEMLSKEILSLPLYPQMTNEQVEYVVEKILSWDNGGN